MIVGNIKKINLGTSRFKKIIDSGALYVDKTRMIENFLESPSDVLLIARHRRLGKSLNMDMLRCFLTDAEDNRRLFKGLYIENSHVWDKACSAPVFYFNFKELQPDSYNVQVLKQVDEHIWNITDPCNLNGYLKHQYEQIIRSQSRATDSIKFLMEIVYKLTGKNSYLLIDEYDNLLMSNYNSDRYAEIRKFETDLLSAALKDNPYLEKALLTGVMRISHESMLSGLNNIVTYDVFSDNTFTDDYGLTENEVAELSELTHFNISESRNWYNGIRVGGKAIYNIYSMMSFISRGEYGCYWGKSGTMDMIRDLLNNDRMETLSKLLNGENVSVSIDDRISLHHFSAQTGEQSFYSFLVQAGYLALVDVYKCTDTTAIVAIPNTELMVVWKNFILKTLDVNTPKIRTLFDNVNDHNVFARDIEYFMHDRLSYHDLAVFKGEEAENIHERLYHVFMLGILSAYDDVRYRYPSSNRESGDGRYDILVERPEANYIFEFKATADDSKLEQKAEEALAQAQIMRYGEDISDNKRLVKVGIAFNRKKCKVKAG